jgi:hypothetical protein
VSCSGHGRSQPFIGPRRRCGRQEEKSLRTPPPVRNVRVRPGVDDELLPRMLMMIAYSHTRISGMMQRRWVILFESKRHPLGTQQQQQQQSPLSHALFLPSWASSAQPMHTRVRFEERCTTPNQHSNTSRNARVPLSQVDKLSIHCVGSASRTIGGAPIAYASIHLARSCSPRRICEIATNVLYLSHQLIN